MGWAMATARGGGGEPWTPFVRFLFLDIVLFPVRHDPALGLTASFDSRPYGHDKGLQVLPFQLQQEIQIVTGIKKSLDELKKLLFRDIARRRDGHYSDTPSYTSQIHYDLFTAIERQIQRRW